MELCLSGLASEICVSDSVQRCVADSVRSYVWPLLFRDLSIRFCSETCLSASVLLLRELCLSEFILGEFEAKHLLISAPVSLSDKTEQTEYTKGYRKMRERR